MGDHKRASSATGNAVLFVDRVVSDVARGALVIGFMSGAACPRLALTPAIAIVVHEITRSYLESVNRNGG